MDFYYGGLKDSIKDEISKSNKSDTLDELIKKTICIDKRFYKQCFEYENREYSYCSNSQQY